MHITNKVIVDREHPLYGRLMDLALEALDNGGFDAFVKAWNELGPCAMAITPDREGYRKGHSFHAITEKSPADVKELVEIASASPNLIPVIYLFDKERRSFLDIIIPAWDGNGKHWIVDSLDLAPYITENRQGPPTPHTEDKWSLDI